MIRMVLCPDGEQVQSHGDGSTEMTPSHISQFLQDNGDALVCVLSSGGEIRPGASWQFGVCGMIERDMKVLDSAFSGGINVTGWGGALMKEGGGQLASEIEGLESDLNPEARVFTPGQWIATVLDAGAFFQATFMPTSLPSVIVL